MVTSFANNQEMTAVTGTPSSITTDPQALGDNDRATVMVIIHYIWALAGGTTTLMWQAQVSNDGVYWADAAGVGGSATTPTGTTPIAVTGAVNGAFIRFWIVLTEVDGTLGGANFDLSAKLDHA